MNIVNEVRSFGVAKLAKHLKVSRQVIYAWKRVPVHHAKKVAKLTGISLKRLRPDVWG